MRINLVWLPYAALGRRVHVPRILPVTGCRNSTRVNASVLPGVRVGRAARTHADDLTSDAHSVAVTAAGLDKRRMNVCRNARVVPAVGRHRERADRVN